MHSFGVLYSFSPVQQQQQGNEPIESGNKPRATGLSADLHINYWELDDTIVEGNQFLDFGLMIKSVALDVESIYFYFPFKIKKEWIEDLGKTLQNDQMISALFNEDFNCKSNTGSPYTTVSQKNDINNVFFLYELADLNYSVQDVPGYGSILRIVFLSKPPIIEPSSTDCDIYIRFRLKHFNASDIFYEEEISNDYIQSAFYKTKMLDFRVNERREMNNKLLEVLETKERHFVRFSKFHFYYIGSSRKEKIEGYVNYTDCRLLDYSKWSNYLPSITNKDKKFLCYHWKTYNDGNCFQSCSVFMRTVFKSLNWKIVLLYFSIAIGLSFIASAIWGVLSHFIIGCDY